MIFRTMRASILAATAVAFGVSMFIVETSAADEPSTTGSLRLVERDSSLIPTANSIALFEKRVAASPTDAGSRIMLGRLCLRKAREDDDFTSFERAESLFREVLEIDASSRAARLYLADALLAQHRFEEALGAIEVDRTETPDDPKTLAASGDALLELGRYDEAEKAYARLAEQGRSPAVLARLAHLAELQGKTDDAVAAIREAIDDSVEQGRSASSVVWYRWRLGSILAKAGRREAAAEQFVQALELDPRDAASLAGLAGVRAAQGRRDEALDLYARAVEIRPTPPSLAQYGDLLTRVGRPEDAAKQYAVAEDAIEEEAATSAGKAHYREVSRYFSGRGIESERALKLARIDAESRSDVYADDTLAWALHRNGQFDEAAEASARSLRLGTRDPLLLYHAGMIAFRRDEAENATKYLTEALKIDDEFAPLEAEEAPTTLATIRAANR